MDSPVFSSDPLHVPPKLDRAARKELAQDLERRMREANRQAELTLARPTRTSTPELTEDHDRATAE